MGGPLPALKVIAYLVLAVMAQVIVRGIVVAVIALPDIVHVSARVSRNLLTTFTVTYVFTAVVIVVLTALWMAWVDRRPPETLGFDRRGPWVRELLLGVGIGIAMPALMLLISYFAGWSRFDSTPLRLPAPSPTIFMLECLVLMAGIAVTEETMFRGYVLPTLGVGYGPVAGLLLSSFGFGAMHIMNPGASFGAFLGTSAAGLILGYAYIITRRLWLPIGFHFAWNLALGPIFGFPVSGLTTGGLVHQFFVGPSAWTGGEFGPEAGLLVLTAIIVSALILLAYDRKTNRGNRSRIFG